jgi:hypothetical protein
MRNSFGCLMLLVLGLVLVLPIQADEVVGALWKIDFKDDKSSIKFQCTKDGKVFGPKGKEIGTWEGKGAQAEITITDGGERNGTYKITKLDKKPPVYHGKYTNDKDKGIGITVTLIKD